MLTPCNRNFKAEIVAQMYTAMERLNAPAELLAIVQHWGAALDDPTVLALIKEWNAGRRVIATSAPPPRAAAPEHSPSAG